MDEARLLQEVSQWHGTGRRIALATVISTWGSSPRAVGAKLAFDDAAHVIGSVSGGCVEGAVIESGREMLAAGSTTRLMEFGVSDEQAWEVGLTCGGRIEVLIENIEETSLFEHVLRAVESGSSAALVTRLSNGERCAVTTAGCRGPLPLNEVTLVQVRAAIAAAKSGILPSPDRLFVDVFSPPRRRAHCSVARAGRPLRRLRGDGR